MARRAFACRAFSLQEFFASFVMPDDASSSRVIFCEKAGATEKINSAV
jgi:hypothetical protein